MNNKKENPTDEVKGISPLSLDSINQIYLDYIYIASRGSFYCLKTKKHLPDQGMQALIDDILGTKANIRSLRANSYFTVIKDVVYDASITKTFILRSDGNGFNFNLSPRNEITLVNEEPIDHLRHMGYMYPDPRDRKMFMDMLCFCIRYPEKPMSYGILIHGNDGIGKSYLLGLLKYILGEHAVSTPTQAQLEGDTSEWAETASVAGVNEIYAGDRLKAANKILEYVGAETISIKKLYIDRFPIKNIIKYFFFSNDPKPIIIKGGMERRIAVIDCQNVEKKSVLAIEAARIENPDLSETELELIGREAHEQYFKVLWDFEYQAGRIANYYLNEYELKDFNPHGDAPYTDARQMLMEVTGNLEEKEFKTRLSNGECGFNEVTTLADVKEYLQNSGIDFNKSIIQSPVQIRKIMVKMGMKPIKQARCHGSRKYFWAVENAAKWQNASDRELVIEYDKPEKSNKLALLITSRR